MNITLPAEFEDFVERRAREGAFGSPSAVLCEALRRWMEEDVQEAAVLEGEQSPLTPLTADDLSSVRRQLQAARAPRAA
jgi:putative addiction module CopG family antidote